MFSLPLIALLGAGAARAESVIEFKTNGPVSIMVDGQQATLQSSLKQRVTGLSAGVHQLEVSGMFGKKLYEAEIELPDNTITYAAWERGEIKVLKTEWLEQQPPEVAEAPAEAPVEAPALPVEAPAVAAAPEVPAAPAADPVPDAGVAGAAGAVAAAGPMVEELAIPGDPDAFPVADGMAVEAATALPVPKSRTLTLEASDGMRIEVVHDGKKLVVVVEGDTFRIQDGSGLNLALGGE